MADDRQPRAFVSLDGLRGVAALAVAAHHMPRVFRDIYFPNAHMAVDFFLQLSGFVIAYAYAERIGRGMTFSSFLWRRFNRLFPTYLVGLALGIFVALVSMRYAGSGLNQEWTAGRIACSAAFNLLMLPSIGCEPEGLLFPLNAPMWSISYELLANILFFLLVGWVLRSRAAIMCASVLLVVTLVSTWGESLSVGFSWDTFLPGAARMFFSFLVGIIIFNKKVEVRRPSNFITYAAFVILAIGLTWQQESYLYEIALIGAVFPALVVSGVIFQPSARGLCWICIQLGKMSYVLYVIHKPLYQILYGALLRFAPAFVEAAGLALGIAMLAFISIAAWGIAVVYEPAARKAMDHVAKRIRPSATARS